MRKLTSKIALAATLAVLGVGAAAFAQPMGPGSGYGPGYGGMGPGMMGSGYGYGDPTAYLDGLKTELAITHAQDAAWNIYADAVKRAAEQMQGVRATMWDAMGTASWQERRDMMNSMFDARQQAFQIVQAAAGKLLPTLTTAQQAKAENSLPGLAEPGHGGPGRWR
ncbi:MAG TPA: Spy/CpxP family protein refolding chaperone [Acetobacteraceae bacterium]|jgi:hypothetical protein